MPMLLDEARIAKRRRRVVTGALIRASGAVAILDAASALFLEQGYDAVSITLIATRARVSKANIFHHFRSKELLYEAVLRAVAAEHAEFAEHLLGESITSTEKLRRLAIWQCDIATGIQRRCFLQQGLFGNGGNVNNRLMRDIFRRNVDAVIALFIQGQSNGEFRRDVDPAVAACMLDAGSSVFVASRQGACKGTRVSADGSAERYGRSIAELLLIGITEPPDVSSPGVAA